MNLYIKHLILCKFLLLSSMVFSQTHIIFLDDTAYYAKKFYLETALIGNVEFRDSLSDGKWVLHNLQRKDSLRISDNTIILTGEFKNYQENGVFNYYMQVDSKGKKKRERNISDIFMYHSKTYQNGELNGILMYAPHHNEKVRYITFSDGKKNGMDISFYSDNSQLVCVYEYDTLIYENFFLNHNELYKSRVRQSDGSYILTQYNKQGLKERVFQYNKSNVYRFQRFFPNQFVEIEMEGELEVSRFVKVRETKGSRRKSSSVKEIAEYKLIKGIERRYDPQGKLIYEKKIE